jgi:hypothetical protein
MPPTGSTVFLVDSPDGLARAATDEHAIAITDNPILARATRHPAGLRVVDASALLEQPEATRMGHAVTDALLALDAVFAKSGYALSVGLPAARLNLTMALRATATALLQRGVMLDRALRALPVAPARIVVAGDVARRSMPGNPWYLPRFAPPAAELARHGFFGSAEVVQIHCPVDAPENPGDQPSDDLVQRLLVLPLPVVLFELWQCATGGRGPRRAALHVGKPAEILREALPWLALRGFSLVRAKLPSYGDAEPVANADNTTALDGALEALARPVLTPLADWLDPARGASVVAAVLERLQAGLAATCAALPAIEDAAERIARRGRPAVLLTSGMYGPIATQFHAAAQSRGVRIVDFEHGATTGIARTSQRRLPASEATTCDLILVSSERARAAFARAPGAAPGIVVGLADQTRRVLRRGLQRWRARAALGLARHETAIVHVSGLVYGGNMRAGDDAPVEGYVFEMQRRLLAELYAGLPYRVFYKPYPAIRLAYQPDPGAIHALAQNVRTASREDFRYLRAAADLIVTDAHMSTLGWCFGADVPVIHLGSATTNALADEGLRAAFAAAFVTFDTDSDGWISAARSFLAAPPAEHAAAWKARARARAAFLADAVTGPPGVSGRRAAAAITRFRNDAVDASGAAA